MRLKQHDYPETMKRDDIEQLDRFATWLDSSIHIPGTPWRIGWDGIIGLIPGVGDLAAASLSGYLIYRAIRLGASASVILRMLFNLLLELIIGAIPVLGDLFDFAFKANQRNMKILRSHLEKT
jgi:hypothetical protein